MPIPKKKLKEARQPLEGRILRFLGRNPEMAYALFEIVRAVEEYRDAQFTVMVAGMEGEEVQEFFRPYREALQRLLKESKITSAIYHGNEHYAIEHPS